MEHMKNTSSLAGQPTSTLVGDDTRSEESLQTEYAERVSSTVSEIPSQTTRVKLCVISMHLIAIICSVLRGTLEQNLWILNELSLFLRENLQNCCYDAQSFELNVPRQLFSPFLRLPDDKPPPAGAVTPVISQSQQTHLTCFTTRVI